MNPAETPVVELVDMLTLGILLDIATVLCTILLAPSAVEEVTKLLFVLEIDAVHPVIVDLFGALFTALLSGLTDSTDGVDNLEVEEKSVDLAPVV